jgi:hypothetical protein
MTKNLESPRKTLAKGFTVFCRIVTSLLNLQIVECAVSEASRRLVESGGRCASCGELIGSLYAGIYCLRYAQSVPKEHFEIW